jgi:hypothetical protein
LEHRSDPKYSAYNHPPDTTPLAHWQHRRLQGESLDLARNLINSGIAARDIITAVSETVLVPPLQRDIYNLQQLARAKQLNRHTLVDALIKALDEQGWISKIEKSLDGRMKSLFMTSTACLEYLKANPDVLIMDSTYKTNRFGLPMLDVIGKLQAIYLIIYLTSYLGIDNSHNSFYIAMVWMAEEAEDDYNFALEQLANHARPFWLALIVTDRELALMNAIPKYFPPLYTKTLLCRWHINKNVVKKCKPAFATTEEWEHFYKA